MSGVDIAGLVEEWRKAMEVVPAGPWRSQPMTQNPHERDVVQDDGDDDPWAIAAAFDGAEGRTAEDIGAWIARCSPSGISALLDTLSEATRQRDEALAALKASAWQPIETAPKDGRDVLLYWPLDGLDPVAFSRIKIGWWNERQSDWIWQDRAVRTYSEPPTHWMPLPPKPQGSLPELADATNNPVPLTLSDAGSDAEGRS